MTAVQVQTAIPAEDGVWRNERSFVCGAVQFDCLMLSATGHSRRGQGDACLAQPETRLFAVADGVSTLPNGGATARRCLRDLNIALAAAEPDPTARALRFGNDRAFVYLNLGELAALTGDPDAAAAAFRQSHAIAEPSLAAAPDDRDRLLDLAWAEARLAQLGDAPAARWPKVIRLLEAADAQEPLADVEEELLTSSKIASGL